MDNLGKKRLFEYIISKLNLSPNGLYSILDFGCGTGDFLRLVSENVGAKSKLLGIDSSQLIIKVAGEKYPNINFLCKKFDGRIDLPDGSFNIIVTIDVLECISDKDALINEFYRILTPGGKVLVAHWDWDTMLYSTDSKDIARRAVAAFSDWKQPWMDNCDGQMGRKLWGLFEGNRKFRRKPDSFNLIETTYETGKYGFDRMLDIAKLAGRGRISRDEYEKLHSELTENNAKGRYFFCLTSFICDGEKTGENTQVK